MIRSFNPTKLQLYSFLASMPVIDVLLNYIMYDDRFFRDWKIWVISVPIIFKLGMASWAGHTIIGNGVKKKISRAAPDQNQDIDPRALHRTLHVIFSSHHFLSI